MNNNQEEFDTVEVIAHFNELKIKILKFKWRSSIYKVTDMLQSWKIPVREGFNTHYVVVCKENDLLCELSFSNTDLKWSLVRHDSLS